LVIYIVSTFLFFSVLGIMVSLIEIKPPWTDTWTDAHYISLFRSRPNLSLCIFI
jgi:hypothetical protein